MRAIFLDIDGILNTRSSWRRMYQLSDSCVAEFASFAKRQDAKIVLTSSWRNGFEKEEKKPEVENNMRTIKLFADEFRPEVVKPTLQNFTTQNKEIKSETQVSDYEPRKEEVEPQRDTGISSSRLDVDNDDYLPPFLRRK